MNFFHDKLVAIGGNEGGIITFGNNSSWSDKLGDTGLIPPGANALAMWKNGGSDGTKTSGWAINPDVDNSNLALPISPADVTWIFGEENIKGLRVWDDIFAIQFYKNY